MSSNDALLQELREIRKLLTPVPPSEQPPAPKGLKNEFIAFLENYKVLGLAVAFIMGIYLGALVKSLVDNLVMPIITLVMPGVAWETIEFFGFRIGLFIGDLITFIIVAFVIFLIVKLATRLGIK